MARKREFFSPPYLYCVTTLPSKTNTTDTGGGGAIRFRLVAAAEFGGLGVYCSH